MRESEDHVEFKKGEQGNVSYNGGDKAKPKDRRKCILGYVTALRNGSVPIREESYIFDIPFFNEDVIRELVNNAFAHRDYRKISP